MFLQTIFTALGLFSPATGSQSLRYQCSFGDDCWPSVETWDQFNASVGGKLIRSVPSAAVCHAERYNADQCDVAKSSWLDSFWKTNQTGGYAAMLWEMGESGKCFVDTAIKAPCDQGIVPYYSVRVQNIKDIQTSVRFASEKDLYLVTKNTGHDHLGRSSGEGAFSIWTHNMKGIEWHDSFVPQGAPGDVGGVPAVTLQAGEQWFDVYQAAAKKNVLVVGGSARTVGAAGGYLLGGGHSPFAHDYGLAVDNLLEMNIVSADGEHRTINAFSDPEYFWAVRGGGGSAWGVVTSVTYITHPVPQNLLIGFVQLNASDNASLKNLLSSSMKLLPGVTDSGYTGYGDLSQGFQGIFLKPNGSMESFNQTFNGFFELSRLPGIHGAVGAYPSTWNGYLKQFLRDPNIGTNIQDTSRLLTADVINRKAEDLAQLIIDNGAQGGFNFIGKVNNDKRDDTAVNGIWKHSHALMSISVDWSDNATESEKHAKRLHAVKISQNFTRIVGTEGGTYINEANPYEPDWQRVFWGDKYKRLSEIKRRVDPSGLFVCNRCVGGHLVLQP